MVSTEIEKLQLGVIRELCLLLRESLVELCDYLIIAEAEFEHINDKGPTAFITLISSYIQRKELEEQVMADLLHLQDKIYELQAARNASTAKQEEQQQRKQDQEEDKIIKEIKVLQLQLAKPQSERDNKNNSYNGHVTQNTTHNFLPHHWHKDFKIT